MRAGSFIALAIISLCGLGGIVYMLFEAKSVSSTARRMKSESNLEELWLSVKLYADDHDDRLPHASNWAAATQKYHREGHPESPSSAAKRKVFVLMNAHLSYSEMKLEPPQPTVLLFEGIASAPTAGTE